MQPVNTLSCGTLVQLPCVEKVSVASITICVLFVVTDPAPLPAAIPLEKVEFTTVRAKNKHRLAHDSGGYQRYLTATDKRFKLQPTNPNKVFSLLNKLDKSKATGLDKISARLVRECADLICVPICDIFNQSINQGTFPDDWKYARVSPLYKQGDRGDVNNYRPISVIPIVAKAFERIVY